MENVKGKTKALAAVLSAAAVLTASIPLYLLVAADDPVQPKPEDYYTVGNDMSSENSGFSGWTSDQHECASNVPDVSPDGAAGKIVFDGDLQKYIDGEVKGEDGKPVAVPTVTSGLIVMNNTVAVADYPQKSQALVFWLKFCDAADTRLTLDLAGDSEITLKANMSPENPIRLVSTKDGSTSSILAANSFVSFPANFEGYVIVPLSEFSGELPTKLDFFRIRPDWYQTNLQKKDIFIDNIGLTGDMNACTKGLSEIFFKSERPAISDNYTVLNDLSDTTGVVASIQQSAKTADKSPDGACLQFTTSEFTKDWIEFTTSKDYDLSGAKYLAFWIDYPKTEPTTGPADSGASVTRQDFPIYLDVSCGYKWITKDSSPVYLISSEDGTEETLADAGWVNLPGKGFKGYVLVDLSAFKAPINQMATFRIRTEWNWINMAEKNIFIDNVGVVMDKAALIADIKGETTTTTEGGSVGTTTEGGSAGTTTEGGTTTTTAGPDDGYIHKNHPDNANMWVGCGGDDLDQIAWVTGQDGKDGSIMSEAIAEGVSPDGKCITFKPTATGGEINFAIDHSNRDKFKDAKAVVFWIKTPDVASNCMYIQAYDKRPDVVNELWGKKGEGSTRTYTVIPSEDSGTYKKGNPVQLSAGTWYWELPTNFEGYVVIPKELFEVQSDYAGVDNRVFDLDYFSQLKMYFEPAKPVAGESFYVDDIGITWDTDAYIEGLKALLGGTAVIDPSDHASHPDNKYMVVGAGFEDKSSFHPEWSGAASYLGVADISPDTSCGEFKLKEGTSGELNILIKYQGRETEFAKGKAVTFWVKTPENNGLWFLDLASMNADNTAFVKYYMAGADKTPVTMKLISAKDGSVKDVKVTDERGAVTLPGGFEGYVVLPFDNYKDDNGKFEPARFNLLGMRPENGQTSLVGQSYFIDDVGLVTDVDKYVANLQKLYESGTEPTEPDGPTEPTEPEDNTPAYKKGILEYDAEFKAKEVKATAGGATITWDNIEGVDHYVLHVYQVNGDKYTYVKTVEGTVADGIGTASITGLDPNTKYAAQIVAMTETDEIIFAYEPAAFTTVKSGAGDPTGSGSDDGDGDSTKTGDALPFAMAGLTILSAAAVLVLRRKRA